MLFVVGRVSHGTPGWFSMMWLYQVVVFVTDPITFVCFERLETLLTFVCDSCVHAHHFSPTHRSDELGSIDAHHPIHYHGHAHTAAPWTRPQWRCCKRASGRANGGGPYPGEARRSSGG